MHYGARSGVPFLMIECNKCVFCLENLEFQDFFSLPQKEQRSIIVISYHLKLPVVTVTNIHFFIRIVKEPGTELPELVVRAGNLVYLSVL